MAPTTPKTAMRPLPAKVLRPPSHPRKAPCLLGGAHPHDGIFEQIATDGMDEWKRQSGYHPRSLVEIAPFRPKQLGSKLFSRRFNSRVAQAHIRAVILNHFTHLGIRTPLGWGSFGLPHERALEVDGGSPDPANNR
jgi:hypothetical protein